MSVTRTLTAGVICDDADDVLLGCTVNTIESVEATLIVNDEVADCCGELESAAFTVKLKVPVVEADPLIRPVPLSVNPGGNCPLPRDQTIGALPPLEVSVWL